MLFNFFLKVEKGDMDRKLNSVQFWTGHILKKTGEGHLSMEGKVRST